jgi:hypothetical protein
VILFVLFAVPLPWMVDEFLDGLSFPDSPIHVIEFRLCYTDEIQVVFVSTTDM